MESQLQERDVSGLY